MVKVQRRTETPLTPEAAVAQGKTLTRDAVAAQPEDLKALRAAGFGDTAIVQITLIAAWFNYINRVANGLGVAR